MEPEPIYEEYPDYRHLEQEEFEAQNKKGFKVINARDFGGYKQIHLEDENGGQHTALAFDSYAEYDQLESGNYVDGYVRINNSQFNLVDYCKPESKLLEGEVFISTNGTMLSK